MSTTLGQPFSAGLTPMLELLAERLKQRLNAGANQAQLWSVGLGALSLSTSGGYQVNFSLTTGKVIRSAQVQGQEAVARSIAQRGPGICVEVRAVDERTQGITAADYKTAEKVLHSLIYVLDEKFSGDDDYGTETWAKTTMSPLAPNVILQFDFQLLIQVHDDAYVRLQLTETTAEGVLSGTQAP